MRTQKIKVLYGSVVSKAVDVKNIVLAKYHQASRKKTVEAELGAMMINSKAVLDQELADKKNTHYENSEHQYIDVDKWLNRSDVLLVKASSIAKDVARNTRSKGKNLIQKWHCIADEKVQNITGVVKAKY